MFKHTPSDQRSRSPRFITDTGLQIVVWLSFRPFREQYKPAFGLPEILPSAAFIRTFQINIVLKIYIAVFRPIGHDSAVEETPRRLSGGPETTDCFTTGRGLSNGRHRDSRVKRPAQIANPVQFQSRYDKHPRTSYYSFQICPANISETTTPCQTGIRRSQARHSIQPRPMLIIVRYPPNASRLDLIIPVTPTRGFLVYQGVPTAVTASGAPRILLHCWPTPGTSSIENRGRPMCLLAFASGVI